MAKHSNYEAFHALKMQAIENNIPFDCAFELTPRCNFDCKMCYVHLKDSSEVRRQELSTEQWVGIFDQAFDAGMIFSTLTGGECLLRKDFKTLYLNLWKRTKVIVNTNAFLISEDYLDFFKQYPPHQIQITLYGFDNQTYQNVTGIPAADKVKSVINALISSGIPVKIAMTVLKHNYKECRKLFEYVKSLPVQHSVVAELISPREGIKREPYMLNLNEYLEVMKIRWEVFRSKPIVIPDQPAPEPGRPEDCTLPLDVPYVRCKAGKGGAFITWKGEMLICATLTDMRLSILKEGFSSAWKKINAYSCAAKKPAECIGCPYDDNCSVCPAIRSGSLSAEHCLVSHCAAEKALYENGLLNIAQNDTLD